MPRRLINALTLCLCALAAVCGTHVVVGAPPMALIPKPAHVEWGMGQGRLDAKTQIIYAGQAAKGEAQTLAEMLRPATGFGLPVVALPALDGKLANAIVLTLDSTLMGTLGKEGYRLEVYPTPMVRITAATTAGLFYGGQTLRELLPPSIYAQTPQPRVSWEIPACKIEDKPRFSWRGYMLDYARHWSDMQATKVLLDTMALHKLNVFHMHLTDDEGWRIEIKKYPKLTEIGAWRGTKCALPNFDLDNGLFHDSPERYGGFFTQAQIHEIVAYAAKLHINVMPEVDMPGHCRAICLAYPETMPANAGGGVNTISPAKESNYQMIDALVGELAQLFPFEYVHIGGDEVNQGLWGQDPEIKALIEREKLGGLGGVQVYFTKRLEGILAKHKKSMIGWNEITNDKLLRTTGIMSWTGTGPGYNAARMGFPVVMAPGPYNYFDMGHPEANDEPPSIGWAGQISPERCYSFDPLNDRGLDATQAARIMGVQACLWAEYLHPWKTNSGWADFSTTQKIMEFKTLPRLCALAEVGWTPQAQRNYADFADRLGPTHLERLKYAGLTFRLPAPGAVLHKEMIEIVPPYKGARIRYTVDASDPLDSPTALGWDGKWVQGSAGRFRARTYLMGVVSPLHVGAQRGSVQYTLKPAATVSTTIDYYGAEHGPDKLVDYDQKTYFWSSRGLRKGESVTINFQAVQVLSRIECDSGKPDEAGRDILPHGILETSSDGITFQKAADFSGGVAEAKLNKAKVKAVRITATADTGNDWVILQDLILQ